MRTRGGNVPCRLPTNEEVDIKTVTLFGDHHIDIPELRAYASDMLLGAPDAADYKRHADFRCAYNTWADMHGQPRRKC